MIARDPPLVSVVVPCYNQAHYLGEAIRSVLAQTCVSVEIIVIDDGSSDNASDVAAEYEAVRCIRQGNRGLAAARNTGLRHSTGRYVVFLDSDDRLLPNALNAGLACLEDHPECAFAFGHCNFVAADGSPLPTEHPTFDEKDYYRALLRGCPIWAPASVMYRRAVVESAGGFDVSVSAAADYALYYRIARRYPIVCHHTVIVEYRQHQTNMTRNACLMLNANSAALRSQWRYVRGREEDRQAYDDGLRFWRDSYGDLAVEEVRGHARAHRWKQALEGALVLLRYHPRAFFANAGRKVFCVVFNVKREARDALGGEKP